MYPLLKIERGHRSKANRITHSWMEKKEGRAVGIKVRIFKEQLLNIKQRCAVVHSWKLLKGRFLSDMREIYRSSLTRDNGFDVQKIQAAEESMHQGRSSNPPLLISLTGWLEAEQIVPFVASWMSGKAYNQDHLQRKVQVVPRCPSTEQVTVMN